MFQERKIIYSLFLPQQLLCVLLQLNRDFFLNNFSKNPTHSEDSLKNHSVKLCIIIQLTGSKELKTVRH